ncbi:MAG: hypothetical protein JHC94_07655 [Acidimicrobiia bacterium]|nr:hypothetical protein [Acidimicrobiia bacterium]
MSDYDSEVIESQQPPTDSVDEDLVDEVDESVILEALPTQDRSPIMTAAGWGLGAIVLLALGVVAWGWIINATAGSAVERFINGEGQVYEGDGFSARFPTTPERVSSGEGATKSVTVSSNVGQDLRFSINWTQQPETAAENPLNALNEAAKALVEDSNGEFVSQRAPAVFGTAASKEFVYKVGKTLIYASMLLTLDRIYTGQVSSIKPAVAEYEALKKGFSLTQLR